jgi:mannose-6-phosphate isomerase-like protein (cupin superfamily)
VDVSIDNTPWPTDTRESDIRPWGSYLVLDEGPNYKAKRIEVFPGKRLSYQRHARRSEHWFVTCGTAKVTLNDREILVKTGESIDIGAGDKHRVETTSNALMMILDAPNTMNQRNNL